MQYTQDTFKELPNDFFKFRCIEVENKLGKHIRIKDIVQNTIHLSILLNKYDPVKVWFQGCKFLNSQTQKGKKIKNKKKGYQFSDNVFLYKDIVVCDIDEPINKKEIERLINFMVSFGLLYKFTIKSHGRHNGIQLFFDTNDDWRFKDLLPSSRENKTKNLSISIYKELIKNGFGYVDEIAFINPRQIFKLPYSYNNGKQCVPVRLEEVNDITPSVELKGSDKGLEQGERSGISSLLISYNVSSRIVGTKDNHILMLDFKDIDYSDLRKKLDNLIDVFSLGTIYVFNTRNNRWHCYCLKPMQFKRLIKIYDYLHLYQMKELLYRQGEVYLRVSPKYHMDDIVSFAPQYHSKVKGEEGFYKISRPHYMFLRSRGIGTLKNCLIGGTKINIKIMKRLQKVVL